MPSKEVKSKTITLRLTEAQYYSITRLADDDNRTISDYIRLLIKKDIKEKDSI